MAQNPTLAVPVTKHDHIAGRPRAPITLVEYGGFEDPLSGRVYITVKHLQQTLGRDLRFVFRQLPMPDQHPHAMHAALAAEAAAMQDMFWPYYDTLFEHQAALEDEQLLMYAAELGIKLDTFAADMSSEQATTRLEASMAGAAQNGIITTPTFFINGRLHRGDHEYSSLLTALKRARTRTLTERSERSAAKSKLKRSY